MIVFRKKWFRLLFVFIVLSTFWVVFNIYYQISDINKININGFNIFWYFIFYASAFWALKAYNLTTYKIFFASFFVAVILWLMCAVIVFSSHILLGFSL